MSRTRHRAPQWLRAAGRLIVRAALALIGLQLGAAVVGSLATAVVAAVLFTVGAVAWWARVIEPRLFATRPPAPPTQLDRAPAHEDRHLAFAQALAAVAARYLDECERESRP
jgi:hypothetical protein